MVNTFISFILISLHKARIYSLALLMILFSFSVNAAQIEASVDRNPVSISDSFQLIFTASKSPDESPNFSPLKQDFDIINQQKSSQLSWVNGSSNKSIQWTLTLMAKHTGQLQIPAISFGDDTSNELEITVNQTAAASSELSTDDELFIEVESSPEQAYVQAQLLYTVRLYQRVNFSQANLSEPQLDNAVIEKLGEDTNYNTQVKGVRYLVTERKYAIFPQQSGLMTIAPLVLTAQVIVDDPRARYNSFFSNHSTQTKRVSSKAIALDVLPTPTNFKGNHWLPAEKLTLAETWSNNKLEVKVGEPITRTITVQATGVTSSQLPELSERQDNSQLKIYPDQAVVNDHSNAKGMIASREQKIAYIPSSSGSFTLPAIEVPWFNTSTKKMELAQLPAVTLNALATTSSTILKADTPAIEKSVSDIPASKLQTSDTQSTDTNNSFWMWLSLFLGLAWLITLALLFRDRFVKFEPVIKIDDSPVKVKDIIKKLNTACNDNNPSAAHQALNEWGKITFNTVNLAALSAYCDKTLQKEISQLNQCLYAKEPISWNGSALWQAFSDAQKATKSIQEIKDEPLIPLYPS